MRKFDKYLDVITNEVKIVEDVTGDKVYFTDGSMMKNPICYRFLGNDTPEPVPEDVFIEDGKMTIAGKEIQTGSLYVKDVVVRYPGNVIVTVCAKEDNDFVELRRYSVAEDRFHKLPDMPLFSSLDVVWQEGELWAAHMTAKHPFSIENEDGEKKEGVQIHDLVAVFDKDSVLKAVRSSETGYLAGAVAKVDRDVIVFTSHEKLVPFEDSNYVVPESGDNTFVTELVIHVPDPEVEDDAPSAAFHMTTFRGAVHQITVCNTDQKSLLLVGDEAFVYTNNGHHMRFAPGKEAVSAALAYPYVVRMEVEHESRTKFVLANDLYETVIVNVDRTSDRGYVVDVQSAN